MFITRRKLNKKLDLLLKRQNIMMRVIAHAHLSYENCKKLEKEWNDIGRKIMEEENGERK